MPITAMLNMQLRRCTLLVLQTVFAVLCILQAVQGGVYLNEWAVEIEGGHQHADEVASSLGFINRGQIGALQNHYLFVHHSIEKRSTSSSQHHTHSLSSHQDIKWSEQQVAKIRTKRDLISAERGDGQFNDPLFKNQWYLHHGASDGGDMNVLSAWQKGYTGKNVVVSILDDGLERQHSDLVANYDPRASYDINGDDFDPTPRYDNTDENRHGTRCAGEVAAMANNSVCGVGVAYQASIGGVRMLDGDVSDYVEARALSMNRDHIDIYSASWGPDDNGKVVDGPARLAWMAFVDGVTTGRQGKGSIFVWASGNGGNENDSCNCDGYTNSIYTLSISSVTEHNKKPWYLEECSSTMASTYSSGASYTERQIVTTDLHNRCTESHTGTSASAPLAAGICALALEANPRLTWRDIQYIVLMTARSEPVRQDGDWMTNGMGRAVSLRYGYGLMDAGAMVSLAERWTTVPEQHVCTTPVMDAAKTIQGSSTMAYAMVDGCRDTPDRKIRFLEHVQARITLNYSTRGNLQISLVSPNGTRSTLLSKRRKDVSKGSFDNWPFMSVHFWGEDPSGRWTLFLENLDNPSDYGTLGGWQLVFYGTSEQPVILREPVRKSASNEPGEVVCHPECQGGCHGPGPQDCEHCRHLRREQDRSCVHECLQSEFEDAATGLCLPCHASCYSCQGAASNECTDCPDGIVLVEATGECRAACPDGYYAVDSKWCRQCLHPCITCTERADRCTSCTDGQHLSGTAGVCIRQCPPNQYKDDRTGICTGCHPSCETCSGGTEYDCLTCPGDAYYKNGTCVHDCGPRFYKDTRLSECQSCHPSCVQCKGGQGYECTACNVGLTLLANGTCMPDTTCPTGHYTAGAGRCAPCHTSCKRCHGNSNTACDDCPSESVYFEGLCISGQCRDGYYELEARDWDGARTRRCARCHARCGRCHGNSVGQCVTCSDGLYLTRGRCLSQCPSGYYESSNASCNACHSSCATCTGPSELECGQCPTGLYLYQRQCLALCATGNFASTDGKCLRCHHACASCTGESPSMCMSCNSGYTLQQGHCISVHACDESAYYDTNNKMCVTCHETCRSCSGQGSRNCTSCSSPYTYNVRSRQCVLCCSDRVQHGCCNCRLGAGSCAVDDTTRSSVVGTGGVAVHNWSDQGGDRLPTEFVDTMTTLVVLSCLGGVSLFAVLFAVLQARSEGYLCFRRGISYQALDALYNNHIMLSRDDFTDDDDDKDEFTAGQLPYRDDGAVSFTAASDKSFVSS